MLTSIQCIHCKFGDTLKDIFSAEDFEGHYICSQYPDKIPDYVDNATDDCPKFEEK